jgi:hypothetical protein
VITYQCEATGRKIELLRFYVPMGLSKQHPDQKALLARTHDYELAQQVTHTAQLLLDIPRITIPSITRDPDVREMQTRAWSSRCSPLTTSTSRLLQQQGSAPVECTQGEGLIFSAVMAWFKVFDENDLEWLQLVDDVGALLNQGDDSTQPTCERVPVPEPLVTYTYEAWPCRTPPAMILLPHVFQGCLLSGGVSRALSKKWLSYKKVRLVVNCINQRNPDGILNPL